MEDNLKPESTKVSNKDDLNKDNLKILEVISQQPLVLTILDEIWKTTSIFLKTEDDLNFFENGRRPQFFF
jgi:hypothetical protein